jgi:hypothetical protein
MTAEWVALTAQWSMLPSTACTVTLPFLTVHSLAHLLTGIAYMHEY